MNWVDDGIFLGGRKFGESSSIVSILTRQNGRHLGLVQGGIGRRLRPVLQVGNFLRCEWNARLEENLGKFRLEMLKPLAACVLEQPVQLSGMGSVCGLVEQLLPERDRCTSLFEQTKDLLESFVSGQNYMAKYVFWELDFLAELGFGLNLNSCVVTGVTNDLSWVSPKSGCAVSKEAGAEYAKNLLVLPAFMINGSSGTTSEIVDGLKLTGYFLNKVANNNGIQLSSARSRFVDKVSREFYDHESGNDNE